MVTAETVSYDFLTQLGNDAQDMGVTDRLVALSEWTTNACGQKALTCAAADNRGECVTVAGSGPLSGRRTPPCSHHTLVD